MTTLGIVQSCYIPWRGYFDLMRRCDLFVLYDCVQYTNRDWRNRNRIKTPQGLHWLTIPVRHGERGQRLCDTLCLDDSWRLNHWETLRRAYARAPHFGAMGPRIQALYEGCDAASLSEVNVHFLEGIKAMLGIRTPLLLLKEHLRPEGDKTSRLIDLCRHHGATSYLSGPGARAYLDEATFTAAGIEVQWMDYSGYRPYPQLYPPFTHQVSVLDMLAHLGEEAALRSQ